jgi:hypothetical protein
MVATGDRLPAYEGLPVRVVFGRGAWLGGAALAVRGTWLHHEIWRVLGPVASARSRYYGAASSAAWSYRARAAWTSSACSSDQRLIAVTTGSRLSPSGASW